MDTSKEYIKMCDAAEESEEIGNSHTMGYGDFFIPRNILEVQVCCNPDTVEWLNNEETHNSNDFIWLPRQDQLQEIWNDKGVKWLEEDETIFAESMEQLWLAFMMKEKYNKVWDGGEWK